MKMAINKSAIIVGIILAFLTRRAYGQLGADCSADTTLCDVYANGQCFTAVNICACLAGFSADGLGDCSYNCGVAPVPPNGAVSTVPNNLENGVATHSCNVGFILNGVTQRTCVLTTGWSGDAPTCVAAVLGDNCASDTNLCNNIANGGCSGGVCACDSGYEDTGTGLSCQRKDCGTTTVTNAAISYTSGQLFGDSATVTCDAGYSQDAITTITCGAAGTWSTSPTCTIKDCGTPTVPNSSITTAGGTMFEAVGTVTCDAGYTQSGGTTITCQADQSWTTGPTCTIKDCATIEAPTDGVVSAPNTQYNGVATFACDTGYTLTGQATRTCQADGTWQTPSPTCVIKDCGPMAAPTNGAVTLTQGTTYGSIAFFSCDPGYAVSAVVMPDCGSDGLWTGSAPLCNKKDCGTLTPPSDGGVSSTPDTLYLAVATFTCDDGYTLTGATTRNCATSGSWDSASPTCVIKDCLTTTVTNGFVDLPTSGTLFEANPTVTCNTGYDQDSLTTMNCQADGTWSTKPTCTIQDCGTPSVVNADLTYTTTKYQNQVTVTCQNGYTQTGGTTITCLAGSTWSSGPTCTLKGLSDSCAGDFDCTHISSAECAAGTSTCECQTGYTEDGLGACKIFDCGATTVPNAVVDVSTSGTEYLAIATVTCNAGYTQTGGTTVTCQADGTWGTPPTCTIKDCGTTTVPNAVVDDSTSGTEYLAIPTVTCNAGYTQTGGTTVTCQDDGTWGTPPTCTIKDCLSKTVLNAVASITTTTYLSVAPVSCNSGYNQDAITSITCQADGTWSQSPTCTLKGLADSCAAIADCAHMDNAECDGGSNTCVCITGFTDTYTAGSCMIFDCSAPSVTNAVVSTPGGTFYGASASVVCNAGYTQNTIISMQCQSDGTWSEAPTCTIKDCGTPSIADSTISTSGVKYQAVATVACNTGYTQSGGVTITCLESGTWSYVGGPTCTIKDCGTPTIEDSTITTSLGTKYLAVATVTCNTGYTQTGGTTVTCQADRTWSYIGGPACTIKNCGGADISNADITYPFGSEYLNNAIVTCHDGYTQLGGSVITCQANETWSSEPSCLIKDCETPSISDSTIATPIGTNFQAIATVTCNTGYTQSGGVNIMCQADAAWSYTGGPTCTIKDCETLHDPTHGAVSILSGTTYLQIATFSCLAGYDLIGAAFVNCTSTGSWSASSPVCQIKDCSSLPTPSNGAIDTQFGTNYGASVTYSCNPGYDLTGDTSRTCTDAGTWDNTAPTCVIKDCSSLTAPTFGTVSYNPNTEYQGLAQFTCNTGYTLVGDASRECLFTGLWGSSSPTCIIKDCLTLPDPDNGAVDLTDGTEYLGVATFMCNTGYTLTGVTSRTCGADALWQMTSPTCVIKDCGDLTSPDDGTVVLTQGTEYLAQAEFACNAGYNMVGSMLRTCQDDGTWETPSPTCVIKDCGALTAPTNGAVGTTAGTTYNQVATYSCDAGYDLSGTFTRTCAEDGSWTFSMPSCNKKDCGPLTGPGNGAVDLTGGTLYQAVAAFSCNTGYSVTGDATRTCLDTGDWGGSNPICIIKNCGTLPDPDHGSVDTTSGITYQSVATYTCITGYTLNGVTSRTCGSDANWDNIEPICIVNDCGLVAAPANGVVTTPDGTTYGQTATYACSDGYKIATGGVTSRICQADKSWSDSMPTCVLKDCDEPLSLLNGYYVANQGNSFGSVATYYCNTNYGLVGNQTVQCESTGYWGNLPVCNPDCGIPVTIDKGTVDATGGTLLGNIATYQCDSGYTLSGSATVTCQANMTWTTEPYCMLGATGYNQACFITTQCTTSGSACLNDGLGSTRCLCPTTGWNYDSLIDQCLADCGGLTSPTNGEVILPTLTVAGQMATYTCDVGYAVSGVSFRICLTTGSWSDATPICVTGCPSPPPPENGNVNTSSGMAAGNIVYYSCNEGYSMVGSQQRICLKDTTWSGNEPTCSKECPTLNDIKHGTTDMSLGNWEGSLATYVCEKDYALVGTSTRECEATGLWGGTEPECIFAIFPDVLLVFGSLFIFLILVDVFVLIFCVYVRYFSPKPKPSERGREPEENRPSGQSSDDEHRYPDVFEEKTDQAGIPPPTFVQSNYRQPNIRKTRNSKISPEVPKHHPPPKPITKRPAVPKQPPYMAREAKARQLQKGAYQNKPGFEPNVYGPDPIRFKNETLPYVPLVTSHPPTNTYQQQANRDLSSRELTMSVDRSDIDGYVNVEDLVKEGYQTTNSDDSINRQAQSAAEEDQVSLDHLTNPDLGQQHQYKESTSEAEHTKQKPLNIRDEAALRFKARMSVPVVPSETHVPTDRDSERFYADERMRRHLKSTVNAYSTTAKHPTSSNA